MSPTEIACRACAAQPGQPCFDGWKFDLNTREYGENLRDGFHLERIFDAGLSGPDAVIVDKKIIERAAEDLV